MCIRDRNKKNKGKGTKVQDNDNDVCAAGQYVTGNGKERTGRTKKDGTAATEGDTDENSTGTSETTEPETYTNNVSTEDDDWYWLTVDDVYIVEWSTFEYMSEITVHYTGAGEKGCFSVGQATCPQGQTPVYESGYFMCNGTATGGCPANALGNSDSGYCVCLVTCLLYTSDAADE